MDFIKHITCSELDFPIDFIIKIILQNSFILYIYIHIILWISYPLQYSWASLVAQMVKNPPPMQETWVRCLGWKDTLEEGMAAHSSILTWRIPMDRGAWWAIAQWVTSSQIWLTNWSYTAHMIILKYIYYTIEIHLYHNRNIQVNLSYISYLNKLYESSSWMKLELLMRGLVDDISHGTLDILENWMGFNFSHFHYFCSYNLIP